MFQVGMSRTLVVILFALTGLAGCVSAPPAPRSVAPEPHPEVEDYRALRDWLDLQQAVAVMTPEEAVKELVRVGKPQQPHQWFYFGLLNQQLKTYASWTQARDAFREVNQAVGLTGGQRQLAQIFERYNQTRINWYQEYSQAQEDQTALQEQLEEARQQNTLLEQKIQALTDLETSISTRKEQ